MSKRTLSRRPSRKAPARPTEPLHPKRLNILDRLNDDERVMFLEPGHLFDAAILGVSCAQPGRQTRLVVYDYRKIIDQLMEHDGMSAEEAIEFIDFNTVDTWVGKRTPMFVDTE